MAKSSLEEFSIPKKGKRKQEKARGNKKKQEKVSQFCFIIPRREERESRLTVAFYFSVEAKEGSGFQKRGKTVTVEAS